MILMFYIFKSFISTDHFSVDVPLRISSIYLSLGIGMTIDDFQIAGIQHDVMESLKSAVRYSIALGPRFFR